MAVVDVSRYAEMDAKFGEEIYKLWGPTLMGFPADTDSSRVLMFTSNQKQMLVLEKPDVPYVLTGAERAFGKYNKAYKELEGTWEVLDKIDKFGDGSIYTLVLYNPKLKKYDMLPKPVAKLKAEKFGYRFNTDVMDSLQVGQKVTDQVVYRSTSYDEHMNYRLGKNALVMYSTSNPTIEDAISVRRGWAEGVRFFEFDNVWIPLNNNDVFINRYGTDQEYDPFPMVGEHVKDGIVASTRRIIKDHILHDFQSKNLRDSYSTDSDYFTSQDALIYDIDVYYNGQEDMPDTIFMKKIKFIYECCCRYADAITAWGKRIKADCKEHPGRTYTQRVPYLIARNQYVTNREYLWKYKDREFSNILINFKSYAAVSLEAGFKLVGRYGDKGVISKLAPDEVAENTGESEFIKQFVNNFAGAIGSGEELDEVQMAACCKNFRIVEDSEMPYMEDGTKVDVLLNASGAIRRLNTGQLVEVDLAFQMECIRKRICELEDYDDKFNLLFRFLEIVNEDEYKFFYAKYASWTQRVTIEGKTLLLFDGEQRKAFIDDVEKNGIRLVKPPHKRIRYDTVKAVYHEFPWIQPVQLYIDKFGIARKPIMRKCIVGYKYLYALKQTTNKNFSARSMGRVNKKGLPEKSTDKRDSRSAISHNPLKLGEVHNLMSSVSGRTMAEHNLFTRSSPIARKSLVRILKATGDPTQIHRLKIKDSYQNVNAQILNAYMKTWGIRLNFITDADEVEDVYIDIPQIFRVHGYQILDCPSKRPVYRKLLERHDAIHEDTIIVADDVDAKIWDMVFEEEEFKETPESIQNVCRLVTKGAFTEKKLQDTSDEEDEA